MKKRHYIIDLAAIVAIVMIFVSKSYAESLYDEDIKAYFSTQIAECNTDLNKLSNNDKNQIQEDKSRAINDLELYLIHTKSKDYADLSSKLDNRKRWLKMVETIERFLDLKSTYHWYINRTGTAGATYATLGKQDLTIAHYLYTESILKDQSGAALSDELGLLESSKLLSFEDIQHYDKQRTDKVRDYLNTYLLDSQDCFERVIEFYYAPEEKEDIVKIYEQWGNETEQTISEILEQLSRSFPCNTPAYSKLKPIDFWLYSQVLHVLKYFD